MGQTNEFAASSLIDRQAARAVLLGRPFFDAGFPGNNTILDISRVPFRDTARFSGRRGPIWKQRPCSSNF